MGAQFPARIVGRPVERTLGSYLTRAVPATATRLPVAQAGDFDDDGGEDGPGPIAGAGGGTVRLRLSAVDDASADGVAGDDVIVDYVSWDGDDEDVEELVLANPLGVAAPANTLVDVWDPVAEEAEVICEATVLPDDAPAGSKPLTVTLDPDLVDMLTADALPGPGESVIIEIDDDDEDDLTLIRVAGGRPVRDGGFLDPDTEPGVNDIPRLVPEVTVVEGLRALFLTWTEVDDATRYQVAVATTADGFADDAPVQTVIGTRLWLPSMPDGSPLATDAPTFVRVRGVNAKGPGPWGEASGTALAGVDPADIEQLQTDLDEQIQIVGDNVSIQLAGRPKTTYSDELPGSTPNLAGETWRVRDGDEIVAEYRGLGGNDWQQVTLSGLSITNLDAGTITFGQMAGDRLLSNSIGTRHLIALAVTTPYLAALAVVSEKIATNQIIGRHILAGEVDTVHLRATAIDGMVITGTLVRTSASGARLELGFFGGTGGAMRAYDEDSVLAGSLYATLGGGMTLRGDNGRTITLRTFSGTVQAFTDSSFQTPTMRLNSGGDVYFERLTTTSTGGTALALLGGGQMVKATSLRREKLVVTPIPTNRLHALLEVPACTWVDRGAAEEYASALSGVPASGDHTHHLQRIAGVIAEDVAAAGLTEFLTYDDDGALQGVRYDRIGVAWIPLVRELVARVAQLEDLLSRTTPTEAPTEESAA